MRVKFDSFYRFGELTDVLESWATEFPALMRVESIGRSFEGREIWLATVTNLQTGPAEEKPALIVHAQIHAMEFTGTTAALHLLDRLLHDYGTDARVTHALDSRCFYVIPRVNPDGAEAALVEGRILRSSVRRYPREEPADGLHLGDIDGDGRILTMRLPDPNGTWKRYAGEPRLMVPRAPDESEGEFFRLLPEGQIRNYDGATIQIAPELEGLDLNRNFPADWGTESEQPGAGPYPASEPETRALIQAIVARPNITGYIGYHTFSGVHLRPYAGRADDDFPTTDLRAYKLIGEEATRLTGYPAVSIHHDFRYDPKTDIKGGDVDWIYDHLGVFAWVTEFWSPQRQAGIENYHLIEWIRDHPPEDEAAMLRAADELGEGYVDWYPFEHSQLGAIELGGWDPVRLFNPPFSLLEKEITPHAELAIFHALISPRLEVRSFESSPVGEGLHHVRLVIQNSGWLPTNVTKRAIERKATRPVQVVLELPEGARLVTGELETELGQLEGRVERRSTLWWGTDDSTTERAKVDWVIEAPTGARIGITARHQRAGTVRAELTS